MNPAANLFIIGPMGAGKTTLGRRVAEALDLRFFDLDHEIEMRSGATVALIFELEGEAGFRKRESELLDELTAQSNLVLATGGGAVLAAENRGRLRERGFVVYLETTVEQQMKRLAHDRKRPLLAAPDRRERLLQLGAEREPLYRETADLVLGSALGNSGGAAARRLLDELARHWRRPAVGVSDVGAGRMSSAVQTIAVELGARSYAVTIGTGLLDDGAPLRDAITGRHVLVVTNEVVAPLYLDRLRSALARSDAKFHISTLILADGEAHKTLDSAARVFAALAEAQANRDATIVALGGGVIGDLAGFAAACWMRGIAFVQVPTTLLAMVDSSVGGKTAVDLPQGKNLVGAFHQPRAVIIDTGTLATLPARELRAGFAEVIKYGALGDASFFSWLEQHAEALLACRPQSITAAIAHCCEQKAGIVARDETERGERALLNLGHTFGHALETASGYGTLLHGEAIAIGMVCAARLSADLGRAQAADMQRLIALLERFGLPTTNPAGLDADRVIGLMRMDKKNLSGRLRLILWRGIGQAEIVADVDIDAVRAVLKAA